MQRSLPVLFAICLLPAVAGAEIYRSVDEDGNVVYTDRPGAGGTPVQLPELSTYESQPAPPPTPTVPSADDASGPAVALSFVQPGEGETVFDNQGNLAVAVRVEPPLQPGQKLALQIDDREPVKSDAPTYQFSEVYRGTHTLKAWVESAAGTALGQPASVTFHMRQASRLFRNPGPQSGPVQQAPQAPQAPTAPNFPASAN